MLVQLSNLLGLSPVVGLVGRTAKVEAAQALGCHVVIDKSRENLWEVARTACPDGYAAVMDSNGISSIQESYDHLSMTGRLIVYGFHSNLPMGRDMLSPLQWLGMAWKQQRMPKFDPTKKKFSKIYRNLWSRHSAFHFLNGTPFASSAWTGPCRSPSDPTIIQFVRVSPLSNVLVAWHAQHRKIHLFTSSSVHLPANRLSSLSM
jgi:hypothetical protein